MKKGGVALLAAAAAATSTMAVNPIRRVVTLLQDMKKEVELEGEKEAALYKKFQCYCKTNDGKLNENAKKAQVTIATNNAAAEEKTGIKKQTKAELKQHKVDRKDATDALAQATEIRKKEKAAYEAAAGEHKEYIDSVKEAIKALQKGRSGAFLQTSNAEALRNMLSAKNLLERVDASDRMTLLNFLQSSKDYTPQSGEIIGILKNMLDEFDETLGGVLKVEEEAVANFNALKAAKQQEIAAATASIEQKMRLKAKLAIEIVQHQNAAEAALKELGDAQQFLVNLKAMCADKAVDWESRSKRRSEELASIAEAIKVLNDDNALDVFKKSLSLIEKSQKKMKKKMSFLQMGRQQQQTPSNRVMQILRNARLNAHGNAAVALMAQTTMQKLKQGTDFSKVMTMIDDMIALLKREQTDEENTLTWCDTEIRNTGVEAKDTKAAIVSMQSEISELETAIAANKDIVAKKETEISDLDKSVTEATAQRKQENEDYDEMIELNTSAVQLIAKAINKLNKFYDPHMYKAPEERELTEDEKILRGAGQDIGDVTKKEDIIGTTQQTTILSLSQSQAPPPPPEMYGAFKKKGAKKNSVVALLNMLSKELQDEMNSANHDEKTNQADYENLMKDAAASRAAAMTAINQTKEEIATEEESLQMTQTSETAKQQELAEVQAQIGQLHGKCDFIIAHFEERRAYRENEIEGLVNAKSVLSGADFA